MAAHTAAGSGPFSAVVTTQTLPTGMNIVTLCTYTGSQVIDTLEDQALFLEVRPIFGCIGPKNVSFIPCVSMYCLCPCIKALFCSL